MSSELTRQIINDAADELVLTEGPIKKARNIFKIAGSDDYKDRLCDELADLENLMDYLGIAVHL